MANGIYRTALTGGGVALDGKDGALITVGDIAFCSVGGDFYVYKAQTSSAAESSPDIIEPDTNPGTIRWVLQQVVGMSGITLLLGNLVKDPQRLPWSAVNENYVGFHYDIAASPRVRVYPTSGTDFWTRCAALGAVEQVTADDTYVTVANVASGAGLLFNLILPGGTSAGDTLTYKITVDGVAYTAACVTSAATDRVFAGGFSYFNDYPNVWGDSLSPDDLLSSFVFHYPVNDTGNAHIGLKNPAELIASGLNVRFESSLKVEMKTSDFTTSSKRDYCGAIYTLDQ